MTEYNRDYDAIKQAHKEISDTDLEVINKPDNDARKAVHDYVNNRGDNTDKKKDTDASKE